MCQIALRISHSHHVFKCMKHYLWALSLLPFFASAQGAQLFSGDSTATGIRFERTASWQQIQLQARKEGKYIFVDCYATWCGPCKMMAREVFPRKNVGDFMNAQFISVGVQMDTSKNDDEFTKAWYADAYQLKGQYKIAAFPTYLFFSPDGKIVHRFTGLLRDSDFIHVAKNAMDPNKQYYTLLDRYKRRDNMAERTGYLADISRNIGNDSLAKVFAGVYIHEYLNGLSDDELLNKRYLDRATGFFSELRSDDKIFRLFYKQGKQIDRFMQRPGLSKGIVCSIITREEVTPKLPKDKKAVLRQPDWANLSGTIREKFNKYYTDMVVLNAQVAWYAQRQQWPVFIHYWVTKNDRYGLDTAGVGWAIINNILNDYVLNYCNNKDTLNKAIKWEELIVKAHPTQQADIDTYAQLLYKVGRKSEAIGWEQKANDKENHDAQKQKREPNPGYKDTLDKMTTGNLTYKQE